MIVLDNIKKTFNKSIIFNNFSYKFDNTGLYVLWGISGSGKTTLLNMIMGIEKYQSGNIYINNDIFKNKVDFNKIQDSFSYIAQDNYFIDYLTVNDNIEIIKNNYKNDSYIMNLLKQFELDNKLNRFPNELSGGEKQRLAMIQALIKNKKVILLDEVTSSLDFYNKQKLINILKSIKDKILIICATHDPVFLDICDNYIDLNNKDKYINSIDININEEENNYNKLNTNYTFNKLIKYMLKKEKNKKELRKLSIPLIIIFIIVFLLSFMCNNYEEKLLDGILINYGVNAIKVNCDKNDNNKCQEIINDSGYSMITRNYLEDSIPLIECEYIDGGICDTFELSIMNIPNKSNLFVINKNNILYGTYFNNSDNLVLGYSKALDISYELNIPVNELIGKEYILKLPSGNYTFTIGGIFKTFSYKDNYYLRGIYAINDNFDYKIYISNEFYEKYYQEYIKDKTTSTTNFLYFDNDYDLIKFYKKYKSSSNINLSNYKDGFVEYETQLNNISKLTLPIVSFILIITMLFYYQNQKIYMTYNENELLIYQYYGYSSKKIKYAIIMCNLINLFKKIIIAFVLSIILSFVGNILVTYLKLIPFTLFKFDLTISIYLIPLLCLVSILSSLLLSYRFNKEGWFKILKERRDLL